MMIEIKNTNNSLENEDKLILVKNNYDEFSIREIAEKKYGVKFAKCHHVDDAGEFNWNKPFGEEAW